eukprot:TRINITY_DN18927_c0_g1_i2.p1 TRINITY_DN18927_c0_g1~~TRINITY_DN18927_c0_g1_i2.p1  ORF type:complete len:106 (-),score=32.66 TRINITY_DN18927_c0_g1_i2:103-420(-)
MCIRDRIYLVCKSMSENEKVVLTGEGADELLFGYDRIFKWGSSLSHLSVTDFAERYSYNKMVDLDTDTLDWLSCLLYTSDAADDLLCVDLGGRRIIKKKKKKYYI